MNNMIWDPRSRPSVLDFGVAPAFNTAKVSRSNRSLWHIHAFNRHGIQSSRHKHSMYINASIHPHEEEMNVVDIPPGLLKDSTAVLRLSGDSIAYVLGISHVSKESCNLIHELISMVKPDAVMVELCHERTGLLVDQTAAQTGTNAWYTKTVRLQGLPKKECWPQQHELLHMMKSSREEPVTTAEIQHDADALLQTGLFESVVPVTSPPPESWDPMFIDGVVPVVELSEINFKVIPRKLPSISQVSVEIQCGLDISTNEVEALIHESSWQREFSTIESLLRIRDVLVNYFSNKMPVAFRFEGVNSGSIKVHITQDPAQKNTSNKRTYITGLEHTIDTNGNGIGVRPLNRPWQPYIVSDEEHIPPVSVFPWDVSQLNTDHQQASQIDSGNPSTSIATIVTSQYAKYQADAGKKVGIAPGAAWRAALAASARAQTPYVYLGDRPSSVTGVRLARAMVISSIPYYAVALAASISSWTFGNQVFDAQFSPALSLGVSIASFAAATWPLLSPILEIKQFSEMSASQIEDAVRVREPLQHPTNAGSSYYLWGEDALIGWPGAEIPVIRERDDYMAYVIHSILSNTLSGLPPAYVLTSPHTYIYAMPKGSSPRVCPLGKGSGQFEQSVKPKTVVAIVGTAHVRGMISRFTQNDWNDNGHNGTSYLDRYCD